MLTTKLSSVFNYLIKRFQFAVRVDDRGLPTIKSAGLASVIIHVNRNLNCPVFVNSQTTFNIDQPASASPVSNVNVFTVSTTDQDNSVSTRLTLSPLQTAQVQYQMEEFIVVTQC